MPNVGNTCLFRFKNPNFCFNGLCGTLYKERQLLHSSNFLRNEGKAHENKSGEHSEKASSYSSNQQFYRHSYERKRKDYQKERARHEQKIEPLIANAPITHYQRLCVDPESDVATIKSAYYTLSKQYHPDVMGEDSTDAAEQFRLITESYDILSDPKSRKEYDDTIAPAPMTPQFTSWQPSGSRTSNQEHIFRMREATRIIKTKQDTFLECERLRNPQKFRSGSFRSYDLPSNPREQIERLDKQMQSLTNNGMSFANEHANFYRLHIMDTIRRRKEDLLMYQDHSMDASYKDGALFSSIITVIGGAILLGLVVVNQFVDIDLAAALDKKLEHASKKIKVEGKQD